MNSCQQSGGMMGEMKLMTTSGMMLSLLLHILPQSKAADTSSSWRI